MNDKYSGAVGVLGAAGALILFFLLRRFFPSIATVLLVIGGIILAGILAVTAAVIWSAFHQPKDKVRLESGEDVSDLLAKGRANLMDLRQMGMRVRNKEIRQLNGEICGEVDRILRTLKERPEKIPGVRQFFNYYLPTLGSILTKYLRLEVSGVPAEHITESTISCLGDIRTAMRRQYTSLFDNDILDLSVEMEALMQVCRRDGLLDDKAFRLRDGDREITLTL